MSRRKPYTLIRPTLVRNKKKSFCPDIQVYGVLHSNKVGTGSPAMSQMTQKMKNKTKASLVMSQMKIHLFYGP